LLAALRADAAPAIQRLDRHLEGRAVRRRQPRLADALLVVAREYGFSSWVALRNFVLHCMLVARIRDHPDDAALELLGAYPWLAVVRFLLDAGAPVLGRSEGGLTALHAAVEWCGDAQSVRMLLDAGADPDLQDGRGRSALQIAAELGRDEMLELMRAP
jgi:ankyrin repeat protein